MYISNNHWKKDLKFMESTRSTGSDGKYKRINKLVFNIYLRELFKAANSLIESLHPYVKQNTIQSHLNIKFDITNINAFINKVDSLYLFAFFINSYTLLPTFMTLTTQCKKALVDWQVHYVTKYSINSKLYLIRVTGEIFCKKYNLFWAKNSQDFRSLFH